MFKNQTIQILNAQKNASEIVTKLDMKSITKEKEKVQDQVTFCFI